MDSQTDRYNLSEDEDDSPVQMEEQIRIEVEEPETETTVEELLIECVRARPLLWDCRINIQERSKSARDNMWLEIYEEFGGQAQYSIEFLVKKWRNLRDSYVRHKSEYEKYVPSGSGAKRKRKVWRYYEAMSFLNDTLSSTLTTSNVRRQPSPPTSAPRSDLLSPTTSVASGGAPRSKQKGSEDAIIAVLNKINTPTPPPTSNPVKINSICSRISDILEKMPEREKTLLEIKLLQITYDNAQKFL